MTGIYCITCTKTNEKYIGQSVAIKRRWATHKRELKQGIHYNKHLQRTYDKYGPECFTYEILEQCPREKLNEREQFYIKFFDSYNNGFNQDRGGCDISGNHNPMYGIKGKEAPRFKDYILQLDLEGNILNKFESSISAAEYVTGDKTKTSSILRCLYTWEGKNYDNTRAFTYKGYQWIYEKDYQKLLPYHDFSERLTWKSNSITTKMINEGTLDGDI